MSSGPMRRRDLLVLVLLSAISVLFVAGLLCSAGCSALSQDRISIARATRLPEEVKGFARVMQEEPVEIGIIGDSVVAKRSIAGYCVVHEEDLARLIQNTEELLRLKGQMGLDSTDTINPPTSRPTKTFTVDCPDCHAIPDRDEAAGSAEQGHLDLFNLGEVIGNGWTARPSGGG